MNFREPFLKLQYPKQKRVPHNIPKCAQMLSNHFYDALYSKGGVNKNGIYVVRSRQIVILVIIQCNLRLMVAFFLLAGPKVSFLLAEIAKHLDYESLYLWGEGWKMSE